MAAGFISHCPSPSVLVGEGRPLAWILREHSPAWMVAGKNLLSSFHRRVARNVNDLPKGSWLSKAEDSGPRGPTPDHTPLQDWPEGLDELSGGSFHEGLGHEHYSPGLRVPW